ncbi:MAG TPA: VTT domain-containing protein [Sphingomicrobium sp.]|nr:VTT domain-containing protein [Sphingomicrobium sp.]
MDAGALGSLPLEGLGPILAALDSELLLAGIFFVATALLVTLCVPGILVPMALGSGALIGAWEASAAVLLGAVAGSQLLFRGARYVSEHRLRAKLGSRFEAFQNRFAQHGILYVIGLRIVGTPHFLVTAGCALMPIRPGSFAVATLIGFLPAIALAAATGSAI